MGLLNLFQSLLGKRDIIADSLKLLNGKVNAKNLVTIFATYLLASKLAANYSSATDKANDFVQKVSEVVDLNECSNYKDVISKLNSTDNGYSIDLAKQLSKAVNLITSIG